MPTPFTRDDLFTAWDRVRENAGCAGSDAVTIDDNLDHFLTQTGDDRYQPCPLLQIVVQKAKSLKTRTLLVPTVRDRVLQTAAARALSHSFEEEFLKCSFAYRPGRGVDRAIARLRELHFQGMNSSSTPIFILLSTKFPTNFFRPPRKTNRPRTLRPLPPYT